MHLMVQQKASDQQHPRLRGPPCLLERRHPMRAAPLPTAPVAQPAAGAALWKSPSAVLL